MFSSLIYRSSWYGPRPQGHCGWWWWWCYLFHIIRAPGRDNDNERQKKKRKLILKSHQNSFILLFASRDDLAVFLPSWTGVCPGDGGRRCPLASWHWLLGQKLCYVVDGWSRLICAGRWFSDLQFVKMGQIDGCGGGSCRRLGEGKTAHQQDCLFIIKSTTLRKDCISFVMVSGADLQNSCDSIKSTGCV